MAKRGRPRKIRVDGPQEVLEKMIQERDYYMARTKSLSDELRGLNTACRILEEDCKKADRKIAPLTKERDDYQKLAEDSFLGSQALAKQLVQAEDRIKELLAEIRIYEHEHATLRHIIIDGLRGYDR